MSDQLVKVHFHKASEQATLLLEAAEKSKDYDAASVRTTTGAFLVPESLAKSAGVKYEQISTNPEPEGETEGEERRPTKKAAAKKSAPKKDQE